MIVVQQKQPAIVDVYPSKAQFRSGEPPEVLVEFLYPDGCEPSASDAAERTRLAVRILRLNEECASISLFPDDWFGAKESLAAVPAGEAESGSAAAWRPIAARGCVGEDAGVGPESPVAAESGLRDKAAASRLGAEASSGTTGRLQAGQEGAVSFSKLAELPGEGAVLTLSLSFPAFETDWTGYGVDVSLHGPSGECLDSRSTAFDVADRWSRSIRYGFLSHYETADLGDESDLGWMRKLHLNVVQFYDWMYRHDELVPPRDGEFTDLMGRTVNIDAVKEKIALCHRLGMRAIAYGAVYAASHAFFERHPDWALTDGSGEPHDFIGVFKIMNTSPESPWRDHIVGQYRQAIERLDFDGIHMDTYGFPKTALSRLNGTPKVERLEKHFPALIRHTREELAAVKPDVGLIFNNVGNWPVDAVAPAPQDAVYIEVWKPYERYHHIRELILWAKRSGGGKPVVLAAYLKPFREKVPDGPEKAGFAALLLTAAIVSHGGSHLLLGERLGVLTQGYYVDHSLMSEHFAEEIRRYYDFQVRYGNLFYDGELTDVSMTHTDWDNVEYTFVGGRGFSPYGQAGKVWTIMREKPGLKTVSLINLRGNNELWNKGKNRPPVQENVEVRVLVAEPVRGVMLASPDEHDGRPTDVPYRVEHGKQGNVLVVTIPRLSVWSLLAVSLDGKGGD